MTGHRAGLLPGEPLREPPRASRSGGRSTGRITCCSPPTTPRRAGGTSRTTASRTSSSRWSGCPTPTARATHRADRRRRARGERRRARPTARRRGSAASSAEHVAYPGRRRRTRTRARSARSELLTVLADLGMRPSSRRARVRRGAFARCARRALCGLGRGRRRRRRRRPAAAARPRDGTLRVVERGFLQLMQSQRFVLGEAGRYWVALSLREAESLRAARCTRRRTSACPWSRAARSRRGCAPSARCSTRRRPSSRRRASSCSRRCRRIASSTTSSASARRTRGSCCGSCAPTRATTGGARSSTRARAAAARRASSTSSRRRAAS